MWSGFLFYFCVTGFGFYGIYIFFKMSSSETQRKLNIWKLAYQHLLSTLVFFSALLLFTLYNNFFYFFQFELFPPFSHDAPLLTRRAPLSYFSNYQLSHLTIVYYFPFIYIFLLVTALSLLFCLSYNFNETLSFTVYCLIIFLAGSVLFFTNSLMIFFLAYEFLLLPSFFILYKFAKTRRCVEAAYLMFFWTQFGAFFLLLSFLYILCVTNSAKFDILEKYAFSITEVNFIFVCWLIGFGVKLPIWPFYNWLPKAHVEASTNFSIFLSGVLVKFAFFGLFKCLVSIKLEPTFFWAYPFLLIGIIDASFKLFFQIDLKKLVAYSTVMEMHWLTICFLSGQTGLILAGFCMLISHALLSSNSFLLVDAINRRFKTRLLTEISGINFYCPKLFLATLLNLLIFLGFPGSIFFVAEFLFFAFMFDLFPILGTLLLIFLYLLGPTFFFRSWMNVMFGAAQNFYRPLPADLTTKELTIYFGLSVLMFWLGLTWQAFLF
jgi:NADH-quinone oxidoreductase subunit M